MAMTPGFEEWLADVLGPIGRVGVKRMFSGAGIYCDGVMLGLVFDDVLYLKTDAETRAAFEAEGSSPFTYATRARLVETSYWRLPDRLLDDPEEMASWARTALGVARRRPVPRSKAAKEKPGRRTAATRAAPRAGASTRAPRRGSD